MWVFTKHGLVSIVECRPKNKPTNNLLIRARERETLEKLLPVYADYIKETLQSDYQFRVVIGKTIAGKLMGDWVSGIDYPNFKGAIIDDAYHDILLTIWSQFRKFVDSKKIKKLSLIDDLYQEDDYPNDLVKLLFARRGRARKKGGKKNG